MQGLDLAHRVPEDLWMEVPNIVQEVVIKTIHKKKKCKKAKETQKDIATWMQSSKEEQGEIRRPS